MFFLKNITNNICKISKTISLFKKNIYSRWASSRFCLHTTVISFIFSRTLFKETQISFLSTNPRLTFSLTHLRRWSIETKSVNASILAGDWAISNEFYFLKAFHFFLLKTCQIKLLSKKSKMLLCFKHSIIENFLFCFHQDILVKIFLIGGIKFDTVHALLHQVGACSAPFFHQL